MACSFLASTRATLASSRAAAASSRAAMASRRWASASSTRGSIRSETSETLASMASLLTLAAWVRIATKAPTTAVARAKVPPMSAVQTVSDTARSTGPSTPL